MENVFTYPKCVPSLKEVEEIIFEPLTDIIFIRIPPYVHSSLGKVFPLSFVHPAVQKKALTNFRFFIKRLEKFMYWYIILEGEALTICG